MESTSREHKVTNHQPLDPATDELSQLRDRLARIMAGLEGCCMTCEPVGARNQQMEREIATLKAERDEARRWFCQHVELSLGGDGTRVAEGHGWDCFKNSPLDRLAKLDEECGLQ
jgi:hypothetical protein